MADTHLSELEKLIDRSHWETPHKVVEYVQKKQRKHGRAVSSEEEIRQKLEEKLTVGAHRGRGDLRDHYAIPIYANHHFQYAIDLLVQSAKQTGENDGGKVYPPYFFIAINTNTKYAFAYRADSKDSGTLLRCLKLLWRETDKNIRSVVSDEEKGLDAAELKAWYTKHEIGHKIITTQNHTGLAIVDRFIRTLRDMNTPARYSKELSHHRKYRDFTEKRMNHLVKIYNNTLHETIKMTPKEMQDDREAETKYIIKKLYQVERRKKISDFELPVGTWVRYIVPRDPQKKNRYQP
jgi:hypothetical protein